MSNVWGMSLHMDFEDCDHAVLIDQEALKKFLPDLCRVVDMVPHGLPMVERFGDADLEGISGMMFIETSSITVHNDEVDNRAFVDLFTCKEFEPEVAIEFAKKYYKTDKVKFTFINRG